MMDHVFIKVMIHHSICYPKNNSSLRLLHPLTKLIKINPLPGLLVNKLRPLHVLRNQPLIQCGIIGNPSLLTNNVGDGLALLFEDFLDFGTRLDGEVFAFNNEGRFVKLMEGRGRGEGPFEGVGDEGYYDVLARGEGGEGSERRGGGLGGCIFLGCWIFSMMHKRVW